MSPLSTLVTVFIVVTNSVQASLISTVSRTFNDMCLPLLWIMQVIKDVFPSIWSWSWMLDGMIWFGAIQIFLPTVKGREAREFIVLLSCSNNEIIRISFLSFPGYSLCWNDKLKSMSFTVRGQLLRFLWLYSAFSADCITVFERFFCGFTKM